MQKYDITIAVEAPDAYDVSRVAAAVGLAMGEEAASELKVNSLAVYIDNLSEELA